MHSKGKPTRELRSKKRKGRNEEKGRGARSEPKRYDRLTTEKQKQRMKRKKTTGERKLALSRKRTPPAKDIV
jgi:hypothetical protein